MNIEYVAVAVMLGLLFLRYKTNVPIFSIFSGMIGLFLAISFSASAPMLAVIFSLFAVYLFYEAIFI